MDLKLKIYFVDEEGEKFMGAGVLWLLEGIRRHGSIRKAAKEMNLSYAKAHMMMRRLEEALGRQVLSRRKGGEAREGAVLTEYGEGFVETYLTFENEIKHFSRGSFAKFVAEMDERFPE
ncbi:winged helix-turn-helix domain-containing protein [Sediminispirochaeta bajacaliforniensis]|uniref:winged helix-turn-helix domain-containing protein n=1 Tax=Sediminispirochaeta bajacaliforniensis TaxID=148 RepID=UPI0003797F7A|nr:LysR family transcriptional regulator [Sediminispirochaeta bajacaliforniensis]